MKSKARIVIKILSLVILLILILEGLIVIYNPISKIRWNCIFAILIIVSLFNIDDIFYLFNSLKEDTKKLFNIYYINYQKVFEICMLINNNIKETIELQYKNEETNKQLFGSNAEIGKSFKLAPSASMENSKTKTYEYKELQNIKHTNSTYLNQIIDVCKKDDFSKLENGDLVKIDNVSLEIINKDEIAQVNSMLSGVLNGNTISTSSDGQVFDININAITNILLKDYKYNLKANKDGKSFYISIPIKAEKEFENEYSIYDLEIGKVNIIGIYRTNKYKSDLINNTFNHLVGIGENVQNTIGDELKKSDSYTSKKKKKEKEELPYIDLIAIVQDLSINGEANNE